MLTPLTITGFYGSLLALLLLGLSFNIIKLRFQLKVGLGDGQQQPLIKAIRIHGNFTEYMPLALILLGCYEVNGGSEFWLHLSGIVLVVGRILHAIGLTQSMGSSLPRQIGMVSTFLVLLILIVLNIIKFFS